MLLVCMQILGMMCDKSQMLQTADLMHILQQHRSLAVATACARRRTMSGASATQRSLAANKYSTTEIGSRHVELFAMYRKHSHSPHLFDI